MSHKLEKLNFSKPEVCCETLHRCEKGEPQVWKFTRLGKCHVDDYDYATDFPEYLDTIDENGGIYLIKRNMKPVNLANVFPEHIPYHLTHPSFQLPETAHKLIDLEAKRLVGVGNAFTSLFDREGPYLTTEEIQDRNRLIQDTNWSITNQEGDCFTGFVETYPLDTQNSKPLAKYFMISEIAPETDVNPMGVKGITLLAPWNIDETDYKTNYISDGEISHLSWI